MPRKKRKNEQDGIFDAFAKLSSSIISTGAKSVALTTDTAIKLASAPFDILGGITGTSRRSDRKDKDDEEDSDENEPQHWPATDLDNFRKQGDAIGDALDFDFLYCLNPANAAQYVHAKADLTISVDNNAPQGPGDLGPADTLITLYFEGPWASDVNINLLTGALFDSLTDPDAIAPKVNGIAAYGAVNIKRPADAALTAATMEALFEDFYKKTGKLPAWAKPDRIRKAEKVFSLHEAQYLLSLLCRALPETYACWKGAKVLATVSPLTGVQDRPGDKGKLGPLEKRVLRTAQFVLNAMSSRGLAEDAPGAPKPLGIRTIQKLRLIHAAIRYFLVRYPASPKNPNPDPDKVWKSDELGFPINQEDLAITTLAFSVSAMDGMRKFGTGLRRQEQEDMLHRWKVIAHIMGVEHKNLFDKVASVDDAWDLWEIVIERQQVEASTPQNAQAGHDLAEALVEYIQHEVIPREMPREIPEYLIRYASGDEVADLLGLDEITSIEPRILAFVADFNLSLLELAQDRSLFLAEFARAVNREIIQSLIIKWNHGKKPHFHIPGSVPRPRA
ncbi:MAG: oxygenase MpaB family protein [bacterium]|nr:oxygenase MpaB family protein [bacterium]